MKGKGKKHSWRKKDKRLNRKQRKLSLMKFGDLQPRLSSRGNNERLKKRLLLPLSRLIDCRRGSISLLTRKKNKI